MFSELSPHTALYARWLMLPVLCLSFLGVLWWEGRLQTLYSELASLRWPSDPEAALAVLFCTGVSVTSLLNAWKLITYIYLQ